jgi:hypothetical protein
MPNRLAGFVRLRSSATVRNGQHVQVVELH